MTLSLLLVTACSTDDDPAKGVGYLRIDAETISVINPRTRIAENYNPKQLAVKIISEDGEVMYQTDDYETWSGKSFRLEPGVYTVAASSNGFDGMESGFDIPYYAGSTKVTIVSGKEATAEITCTLANVKVTVNFSESFQAAFTSANVTVSSAMNGIASQLFTMGQTTKSAYFPVANLKSVVSVVNKAGVTHTSTPYEILQVKARDHHILNYTVAETGSSSVTVEVDGTETVYTFRFPVSTEPTTSLGMKEVNAWSSFAYVTGEVTALEAGKTLDPASMKFEYSTDGNTWHSVAATATGDKAFKATLTGLTKETTYRCRMSYAKGSDNYVSTETSFTTDSENKIPNLSFDAWVKNGKHYYANASMEDMFWDSGNEGANLFSENNPTKPEENDVISDKAARLGSIAVLGQFAAGSLFTGDFGSASISGGSAGATLDFGRPFTERPSQLTGYYKYTPGSVTNTKLNYVPEGTPDSCSVYIALTDWTAPFQVNTGKGTFVDFNADYIIAYGELDKSLASPTTAMQSYQPFTIDILYRDLTRKPKYILIVCSSSKYGDYFTGSTNSVLYLDEFDLIYGQPKTDPKYVPQNP